MVEVTLGDQVRDTITGFKGIAIAKTEWLYGCDRIGIQPEEISKDGKPIEAQWFDEPQVEVLKTKHQSRAYVRADQHKNTSKPSGGPHDEAKGYRKDATR